MIDAPPRVKAVLVAIGIAISLLLWWASFDGCAFLFGCWV